MRPSHSRDCHLPFFFFHLPFVFAMFRFATPCFDSPCLGLPPYLRLPCLCLPLFDFISSHLYVWFFYKKLMLQWQWQWPSYSHATFFFPREWTTIFLLPSLFIFSPLFLGFMLLPIPHSMSSPYPPILTLLVFTSFCLYFTPSSLPYSMYSPYSLTYVSLPSIL
jgi:hypothetical protein